MQIEEKRNLRTSAKTQPIWRLIHGRWSYCTFLNTWWKILQLKVELLVSYQAFLLNLIWRDLKYDRYCLLMPHNLQQSMHNNSWADVACKIPYTKCTTDGNWAAQDFWHLASACMFPQAKCDRSSIEWQLASDCMAPDAFVNGCVSTQSIVWQLASACKTPDRFSINGGG